jgi:heterodisulfide reductase subunit C2
MTIQIKRKTAEKSLKDIVEEMSGVDLSACYQCKKCASGCPVTKLTKSPPSEIVRRLHLGAGDELLESDLIWMCLSCETCYGRCPMQINIPAVIDALRVLAIAKGVPSPRGNVPLFNRMFLETVKAFGRTYDLAMIAGYKLGSGQITSDVDKLPAMLAKGKMAVLPPTGAGTKTVKRIFDRTGRNRGKE